MKEYREQTINDHKTARLGGGDRHRNKPIKPKTELTKCVKRDYQYVDEWTERHTVKTGYNSETYFITQLEMIKNKILILHHKH